MGPYLYVGVILLFLVSTQCVEIKVKEGNAAVFYLPRYRDCGRYFLVDPRNATVLAVHSEKNIQIIGNAYGLRAYRSVLINGTIMFGLQKVTEADTGTYLIKGDGRRNCDHYFYALMLTNASPRWLDWGGWTAWSITCDGVGERVRRRSCTKIGQCQGRDIDIDHAKFGSCHETTWLSWSEWTSCSQTCGWGRTYRTRNCSDVKVGCDGDSRDIKECNERPCSRTDWTDWSPWSVCSVTCNRGTSTRTRSCNDVTNTCRGHGTERRNCAEFPCPSLATGHTSVRYHWTTWSPWSDCRKSCGKEDQKRDRKCYDTTNRQVHTTLCGVETEETVNCKHPPCDNGFEHGADKSSASSGSTGESPRQDIGITVPLSGIVGTVAAIFIIILLIVVIMLITRLKRKNTTPRGSDVRSDAMRPGHKETGNKSSKNAKKSVSICEESDSHFYAEIDEDVIQKRNKSKSVITLDNPYSELPKSATPSSKNSDGGRSAIFTTNGNEESVFLFENQAKNDNSTGPLNRSLPHGTHFGYQSTENGTDGGYLTCTPESSQEHLDRQTKRYTRPKK